ncbi:MAG: STAS domain-containing protein [Clostridia bacterium]|mgnify:CR=1 FL=1|nr:STAS domain-containing protein [Clostridia bacterium]
MQSIISSKGIYTVITLRGELDESCASALRTQLDAQLSHTGNNVVFDFQDVSFMDSTGIGMLLGRYKKLKAMGKNIYIANPHSHIDRIMSMSGMYTIMKKIAI